MSVLDSPLEALAFNYVTYGVFTVVNNLWTWVAVITAAVSFWRIRAAAAAAACLRSEAHSQQSCTDRSANGCQFLTELSSPSQDEEPLAPVLETTPVSGMSTGDVVDGKTKGKFTLLYKNDENEFGGSVSHDACLKATKEVLLLQSRNKSIIEFSGEWENGGDCNGEWWQSWERALRMGERGWYRYQDLTVINGNVVRLWDDCRLRRRYSSRSAVTRDYGEYSIIS